MTNETTPRGPDEQPGGAQDPQRSASDPRPGTPVVGIGGSADAQDALLDLLGALPPATGIAFVVVQHGAAGPGTLPRALRGRTALKVQSVTRRTRLHPDTVYVLPPGRGAQAIDGALVPTAAGEEPPDTMVVDAFLRSLADAHGAQSAAVLLGGAGADGSAGLQCVQARGGLALTEGVLPLAEMPQRLLSHFEPQATPSGPQAETEPAPQVQAELLLEPAQQPQADVPQQTAVSPEQVLLVAEEPPPAAADPVPVMEAEADELAQARSDLGHLVEAAAVAAVFLDRALRITRYTPAAVGLFHLIPADVGRPLTDLSPQLDYPGLGADLRGALEGAEPVQREVPRLEGGWVLVRVLPCRGDAGRITGVVLSFTDISALKAAGEALRQSENRLRQAAEGARHALHSLAQALSEIEESSRRLLAQKLASPQRELAQAIQRRTAALQNGVEDLLVRRESSADGN